MSLLGDVWQKEAVACACTAEWAGDLGGYEDGIEGAGYELKAVTSLPKYRKLGLVQRCLQALIAELRSRAKNGVLRLWVHAIEECTRTY